MKTDELIRRSSKAVVFDALGTGLVMSLTVLYFTLLTDVPLASIGIAASAANLVAIPLGFFGGWLCDRFSSRAALVVNNALAVVGYVFYLVADDVALIFLAILLVAIGDRIYWAAWTAYIHDLATDEPYERMFARLESIKMGAMGVGAAASVVTLGAAAASGARWLVILNIAFTGLAAVLYARVPLPARNAVAASVGGERRAPSARWNTIVRQPGFVALAVSQFFQAPLMLLANFAISVHFVTNWHMNPSVASVLFGVKVGLIALLQRSVTHRVRFTSRARLVTVASLGVVLVLLSLIFLPPLSGVPAWTVVILVGVMLAVSGMLYLPATNAFMAELPAEEVRGVSISVFQTSMAVGGALYPAALGLLNSRPDALWVLTSASVLIGAAAFAASTAKAPAHVRVSEVAPAMTP